MFSVVTRIVAFLCALVCMASLYNPTWAIALSVLGYIDMAQKRNGKTLVAWIALQTILGVLLYGIYTWQWRMPIFSEFTVLLFFNLYPVFITAWNLVTTPPGELSAFLSRRGLPLFFILGLLVVFRFFPTIKTELGSVVQSMRNRGLTRAGHLLGHPIKSGEFILVPLLLRCLQVADQLTISAIARGAERPGVRGSYYGKTVGAPDVVLMLAWIVCIGLAFAQAGGLL